MIFKPSFAYIDYYKQLISYKDYRIQSKVYDNMAEAFSVVFLFHMATSSIPHGTTQTYIQYAYKEIPRDMTSFPFYTSFCLTHVTFTYKILYGTYPMYL
jgi:hypothetical protein